MATKKDIIILTLVISHESAKPTVRRGFCRMWFTVKTKIKYQVEEYVNWKSKSSSLIAKDHKEILDRFIELFKYKEITEIKLEDVQFFRDEIQNTKSQYTATKSMIAIRSFLHYYRIRKQISIEYKSITNEGVVWLLSRVEEKDILQPMKDKKVGRPPHIALIKQVKVLRDEGKLSFRAIALVLKKDVSQIHVWYKYQLPKDSLKK